MFVLFFSFLKENKRDFYVYLYFFIMSKNRKINILIYTLIFLLIILFN